MFSALVVVLQPERYEERTLTATLLGFTNAAPSAGTWQASGVVDDDRLDLGEEIQSVRAFFPAPSALFHAAPRAGIVEGVVAIHPDGAGVESGGSLMGFADVFGPDAGGEAEGCVVSFFDGVGKVFEGESADDGAEDLFAGDAHVAGDVSEDGGFDEVAFGEVTVGGFSAGEGFGFGFVAEADVLEDALL